MCLLLLKCILEKVEFIHADLGIPIACLCLKKILFRPLDDAEDTNRGVPGSRSNWCTAGNFWFSSQPNRTVEVISK
jgi:hypothetical protein